MEDRAANARCVIMRLVQGFDVNRYMHDRSPDWEELERLLGVVDQRGLGSLDIERARRFGNLYRSVSSDLIRARTEVLDASVVDYLNDLVARAYAHIYTGTGGSRQGLLRFLLRGFPRLVRHEWRVMLLSGALLFSGVAVGATFMMLDPQARGVLIPDMHQAHTPEERVNSEEQVGGPSEGSQGAAFSSFLFTHNIQVTFLVFALGITFGLGTAGVLFYNGVPLGALAVQYHLAGKGTFFWAWILPHGIPELTVVIIGGAAGLILARGLWLPGRLHRRVAVVRESKSAVRLVLGGMPILVLAGLIEGTISQIHEPTIPYAIKLLFAAIVGVAVYGYLLGSGRQPERVDATGQRD